MPQIDELQLEPTLDAIHTQARPMLEEPARVKAISKFWETDARDTRPAKPRTK